MTDEHSPPPDETPQPHGPGGDQPSPQSEEIRHSQVSARVPERIARGVFSTGAVVVQGAHEFIIDFLLRMTNPQQLAARIVMPPTVVGQLIAALGENLSNYERKFGPPTGPPMPKPPEGQGQGQPQSQSSAKDLYDQLKIPDDVVSGAYANAVLIGHTPTDFCFDFITTFFPRSSVSCRVYLAAPNAKRFHEALRHSFEQYRRKLASQQPPPAPPSESSPGE